RVVGGLGVDVQRGGDRDLAADVGEVGRAGREIQQDAAVQREQARGAAGAAGGGDAQVPQERAAAGAVDCGQVDVAADAAGERRAGVDGQVEAAGGGGDDRAAEIDAAGVAVVADFRVDGDRGPHAHLLDAGEGQVADDGADVLGVDVAVEVD